MADESSTQAEPPQLPSALDLGGRRALVTGASRGIGRATARCLAEFGADLVVTDVSDLTETSELVKASGRSVEAVRGDLTDEAFVQRLIDLGPFYAVASVAAVFSPLPNMTAHEGFHWVMDVNLRAPILLADGCMRSMAQNGGGRIVLVGSAAGRNGGGVVNDSLVYATYAGSKGGLHTIVRWLSRRGVSKGVLINGIAPGPTDTPLNVQEKSQFSPSALPLGRMGTAEEVAWAIAFMCTPAAGFISGAVLDVNGGSFVG
jgi:3-oxoacyl-[acyl-carrier protein] reductase